MAVQDRERSLPLMSNEGDLEQAVELRSTEPGWGLGVGGGGGPNLIVL